MRALIVLVLLAVPALAAPTVTVTPSQLVLGEPIYFDVGKATIKSQSYAILDHVAAALTREKKIGLVEIQVHTDARGSASFNLRMSQKRAEAIHAYLVAKGIAATRLRAKGYGETRPLDKEDNAPARAKNRRTVFVILQTT